MWNPQLRVRLHIAMLQCTMLSSLALTPRGGFRDAALFRPASLVLVAAEGSAEAPILSRNIASGGFRGRLMAIGTAPDGFEVLPTR